MLWGHYADNHKGICLGFDLWENESDGGRIFEKVTYVSRRKNYDERILAIERQPQEEAQKFMKMLLLRKYKGWRYEVENMATMATTRPVPPLV